jgi:amidase
MPMHRIPRDLARKFAFDWRDQPLLHVKPGEPIEIDTHDASSGYFRTEADLAVPGRRPGFDRLPPLANPIGGPIFVEGAERGDALAISIEEIRVADFSWTAVGPNRGPLGQSARWPELSGEYSTRIFRHHPGPSGTLEDGTLQFNETVSWPLTPFVGTLGVAPDREVTTSIDGQGPWGGNLDIRDVSPGNRILLPVFHPGALFYLGDVHASQGDTEFSGTAAETNSTVRLRLDLLKGLRLPFMRIEKPDSLIALAADRPLEHSVETATIRLMEWLVADYGFSQVDAYCFVSTCPGFRINVYQMCRMGKLSFVSGAEAPRAYLPPPKPQP